MNIQTQCCGIVLLLVLFYYYIRQRKVHLNTEKAFVRTFCASLLCISLDVLSIVAITYMASLPHWLTNIICKTYPASILFMALCCFLYVCEDLYLSSGYYHVITRIFSILAFAGIVLIYILPIYYLYKPEENLLYTYGPSIITTYVFTVIFLFTIILIMFLCKNHINPIRREAVCIWMLLWIIAAVIQFINKNLLLVGYAECVGIMIMYLKMENPETNIDRKTNLFNQNALGLYIRQLYAEGTPFFVISILLEHFLEQNMETSEDEAYLLKLSGFLLQIPKAKAFKNSEEEIILILKDVKSAQDCLSRLQDYLGKEYPQEKHCSMRPHLLYIPNAMGLSKGEDLFNLLHYAWEQNQNNFDTILTTVDDAMIAKMYQEKSLRRQIINAIENDLVEVFYQPIFSTKEQRFTSAEALVRIRDEKGNLIPPGHFIDIAEKTGMILRLGEIVFEKVCLFVKEHRIKQYGIHYIEVNLSVVQCADEHLAETYINIMEKHHVNPDMINLEITESASLNAKKILLDNMKCLMNYGVKFSLDDFGTGQSNLNYIVDMPVSIVKFDREMTNAYFMNNKARYVMDAAMHMIHGMKLQIVSEGIETKEQYETMNRLGISFIQGYYFSKPLPEKEFLEFLCIQAPAEG